MSRNNKATISVCIIVKNEERFLRDCLQSVSPVADQIVVLDTGSTDRTVAIAEEMGADVRHFEWCNDFAAARNASIAPATGDWILWIDADERLAPSSIPYIKNLSRENRPVIGQVQINNKSNDDADVHISTAFRLFRNKQGIYFYGMIHEQLSARPPERIVTRRTAIQIDHLGYALEEDISRSKLERNGRLLEQQVKNEPENAYAHFTLGQNYNLLKEPQRAIRHFEKAFELNQFKKELKATLLNVWAETCLKLGQEEKALELAGHSAGLEKMQVGAFYLIYKIQKNRRHPLEAGQAVDHMRRSEAYIRSHGWQIGTDVLLGDDKLDFAQAELEAMTGNWEKAMALYNQLIKKHPHDASIKVFAGKIFLQYGRLKEAEIFLTDALRQLPARLDILELLGIIYIKTGHLAQAIDVYEALHAQAPNNVQVSRRLAGLYVKTGAENKAMALL